jgi:hypothetical protein
MGARLDWTWVCDARLGGLASHLEEGISNRAAPRFLYLDVVYWALSRKCGVAPGSFQRR